MPQARRNNVQKLPPLFTIDDPVGLLTNYRAVWIKGRYGGGKTSVGIWIAIELLKRKQARRLVTNIPLIVKKDKVGEGRDGKTSENCDTSDEIENEVDGIVELPGIKLRFVRVITEDGLKKELVDDHKRASGRRDYYKHVIHADTVFLLDEAWGVLGVGNDTTAEAFLGYIRKLNQFVVAPSVRPVHKELTSYKLSRAWNGRASVGIPVWLYRVEADDVVSSFYFRDFRVFDWYDTKYIPKGLFFCYEVEGVEETEIKREKDKLNLPQFLLSLAILIFVVSYLYRVFFVPIDTGNLIEAGISELYQSYLVYLPIVSN